MEIINEEQDIGSFSKEGRRTLALHHYPTQKPFHIHWKKTKALDMVVLLLLYRISSVLDAWPNKTYIVRKAATLLSKIQQLDSGTVSNSLMLEQQN